MKGIGQLARVRDAWLQLALPALALSCSSAAFVLIRTFEGARSERFASELASYASKRKALSEATPVAD